MEQNSQNMGLKFSDFLKYMQKFMKKDNEFMKTNPTAKIFVLEFAFLAPF